MMGYPKKKREKIDTSSSGRAFAKFAEGQAYDYQPASEVERRFRHSYWAAKREKVYRALVGSGIRESKLWNFRQCGSCCTVEFSDTAKRHRVRCNTCKCRHCEPCMRQRANRLAANLKQRLVDIPNGDYRFITLTLKHSHKPLAEQIKRLFACFRRLRAQPVWRDSQKGGCHILEVKWISQSREWHPHLHCVMDGGFMQKSELVAAWHKVTGDSFIVDIQQLKTFKDAAHYLCKYVSKGTSGDVWNDRDASQEWITAVKGVRICATTGTWRGYQLMKIKAIAEDWVCVGTLDRISKAWEAGETWAEAIMLSLRPPGAADEIAVRSQSP